VTPFGDGLAKAEQANDIWCVDYKGQFKLGNQRYVYPLTITDQFSRFILACEGFEKIDGGNARAVFERLFDKVRASDIHALRQRSAFCVTRPAWALSAVSVVDETRQSGQSE